MKTKKCNKCGIVKDVSEFGRESRAKNGYKPRCKSCSNEYYNSMYSKYKENKLETLSNYGRTKHGLVKKTYASQKASAKRRCHNSPTYTFEELKEWLYSQPIFHVLYDEWKLSGYKKELIPSCDRLDDYKSYSLSNIRIVTWEENSNSYYQDVKNGINNKRSKAVIGISKSNGTIIEFESQHIAARKTGTQQQRISYCCLNKKGYKSAGGYYWKFKK